MTEKIYNLAICDTPKTPKTEGSNRLPILASHIRRAHADVQEAAFFAHLEGIHRAYAEAGASHPCGDVPF